MAFPESANELLADIIILADRADRETDIDEKVSMLEDIGWLCSDVMRMDPNEKIDTMSIRSLIEQALEKELAS
jgi:hypothetical protein